MDLKDKVAVVTGGAQGLGRSFVDILLKNGSKPKKGSHTHLGWHKVAIIDVNESLGNELKVALDKEYGPDRAEFYAANVTSEEEFKGVFQKIVEKNGRINIVCNNAGVINENDWEKAIAINLGGVIRGTFLALEHMRKDNGGNGGVIVNIASMAGLGPLPIAPIYTATKHGVMGFSRAMAAASQMANYGVRINILCPGFVKTNLLSLLSSKEHVGRFFELKDVTKHLMEKYGFLEADNVAKAFLVLVKDESRNGDALMVHANSAGFISFPQDTNEIPFTTVSLQ